MKTDKIKVCIDKVSVRNIVAETTRIKEWIRSDDLEMSLEDREILINMVEDEKNKAFRNCIYQKGIRR